MKIKLILSATALFFCISMAVANSNANTAIPVNESETCSKCKPVPEDKKCCTDCIDCKDCGDKCLQDCTCSKKEAKCEGKTKKGSKGKSKSKSKSKK